MSPSPKKYRNPPKPDADTVPILEEVAVVSKQQTTTGKVRISTQVDVVPDLVRAMLQTETVEVTRVPVDRIIEQAVDIRVEGDTTIIPVMEEVLVVEKRLVLKEEIHVRLQALTESVEVPVSLRKQRAVVERVDQTGETVPEAGKKI